MCSMAADLRSSSATVACIASATDAKKIKPSPFLHGSGENFVEIISRSRKSLNHVTGPSFEQSGRPALRHFCHVRANEIVDLALFVAQRFTRRADNDDSTVGQNDFRRKNVIGSRAVNW